MEQNVSHAPLGKEGLKRLDTRCHIHLHSRRFQLTDPGGASPKAVIDELVHSKILSNDTAKEVSGVTESQEKVSKAKGEMEETIITITREDIEG